MCFEQKLYKSELHYLDFHKTFPMHNKSLLHWMIFVHFLKYSQVSQTAAEGYQHCIYWYLAKKKQNVNTKVTNESYR